MVLLLIIIIISVTKQWLDVVYLG